MASGKLHRIKLAIEALEDGLLTVLLVGMIGLGVAQILLRNFWQTSLSWGDPVLRIALLWLTLLGAIVATRDRNHISIDLLSHFLPPVLRIWSQRLTDLFAALVCALLSWQGARFTYFEWQDESRLLAGFPAWIAEAIIPVGFGIIALRFLVRAIPGRT